MIFIRRGSISRKGLPTSAFFFSKGIVKEIFNSTGQSRLCFCEDYYRWETAQVVVRGEWQVFPNYLVNTIGEVKNRRGQLIKVKTTNYPIVHLRRKGKVCAVSLHRMVATTFVGLPNPLNLHVHHLDRNSKNYRAWNLTWVTQKLNNQLKKKHRGRPIFQYTLKNELIQRWNKACDASYQLGINQSSICRCCRGYLRSAGGFIWMYEEHPIKDGEICKTIISKVFGLNYTNYSVSNCGYVRNIRTKRILVFQNVGGYMQVQIRSGGVRTAFNVHKLVAIMFHQEGYSRERCFVDHIDGNKINNASTNLRWVTKAENNNYYIESKKK